jgi:PAS domain S-box-containing protein
MMTWHYSPYLVPLALAASITLALAIFGWQRRSVRGARHFAVLMLAVAEWSLAYAFELASPADIAYKEFWDAIEFLGIVVVPAAWLAFALEYTGQERWLTKRRMALLTIEPVVTVILVFTNRFHGLIWNSVWLEREPAVLLGSSPGPVFWAHTAYSYLLLVVGTLCLVQKFFRAPRLYRLQAGMLVIAALVPWLANILPFIGLRPLAELDLTPFAFTVTGLLGAWSLFRLYLLDVVPAGRDAAVEGMHDGVVVLDDRGRVVDSNPAALALLGCGAETIIGQTLAQAAARSPEPLVHALAEKLDHLHEAPAGPAEILLGQGPAQRSLELGVLPLHDHRRQQTGWLVVLHDVTDRNRAAEDLRQAKEAAEAASRAKSTFLANISHEVRTPLTAIIGYSELLQQDVCERGLADLVSDLERIRVAGTHLLTLINDVLNMSRIEAGRTDLFLDTFDVARLVDDVATTARPLIEQNRNTLDVHLSGDVGTMHADAVRVRQILINLLGNAAKFTEGGTVTLTVTRETAPDGDWIVFRVADTGIGMSPAQVEGIFEPFTQADNSISLRYGGTGLGLAIAHRLCLLMDGEIAVDSEMGHGAVFTVRLPAHVAAPTADEATPPRETRTPPGFGPSGVLIIGASPPGDRVLTTILASGRTVHQGSLQEALERTRVLHPDTVILNMLSSEGGGWNTLEALRSDPELGHLPVILVAVEGRSGLLIGLADSLVRPIRQEQLRNVLQRYRRASIVGENVPSRALVIENGTTLGELLRSALDEQWWAVVSATDGASALLKVVKQRPDLILLDLLLPETESLRFLSELGKHPAWRSIPIAFVRDQEGSPAAVAEFSEHLGRVLQRAGIGIADLANQVRELLDVLGK